jgi:hypothetical protein
MGTSPYPSVRIPVDRSRSLPGAPRGPRTSPVAPGSADRDGLTVAPVNGAAHYVHGRRVAPVTGRKARRSAGWSPVIAGGARVETFGQRYLVGR